MFNNLIESKPKKQRTAGWNLASMMFVAGFTLLAAYATANAGNNAEDDKQEEVEFVEVKKDEPPPPEPEPEPTPPPPDMVAAPPPPKGFQVLTAPIDVPDVIPDVDLTKRITDEADFSGKGVAGGLAKGVVGGTAVVTDQTYFEFQVEKPAAPRPGNPAPKYPQILQQSQVTGNVVAQFVVDTSGRADMKTFKVLSETHPLFGQAVRAVLPSMRFLPAEVGGRPVKQLVQQPFAFNMAQ